VTPDIELLWGANAAGKTRGVGDRCGSRSSPRDGGCLGRGEFDWALTRVGVADEWPTDAPNNVYSARLWS
jgi:hypothetical protein